MHCPECDRTFDPHNPVDVAAWYYGHDCDVNYDPSLVPFYFTFGMGYSLANTYAVVHARTQDGAREIFQAIRADTKTCDQCGIDSERARRAYAFDYNADRFAHQPTKWGLRRVDVREPIHTDECPIPNEPPHYIEDDTWT